MPLEPPTEPIEDATSLRAENARLRLELEAARAEAAAAREHQHQATRRISLLAKANELLDQKLFVTTLAQGVMQAAEEGEDLDRFGQALFDYVCRLVAVDRMGLRLARQGLTAYCRRPNEDAGLVSALDALAAGREPDAWPAEHVYTRRLGRPEAPFGVALFISSQGPLTERDRTILDGICHHATPILEHNLLIRLLVEMAGFQEEWVNMLSHDLRNPLTGVISSLSTAMLPNLPLEPKEREDLMRTALTSAQMMNEMITDLLDVAKMEAGRMQLPREPVALGEVLERGLAPLAPVAKAKRLTIALDVPEKLPTILGDGRKLARVFSNLIGNALKYTHKGGVVVSVRAREHELEVAISDTGFGIPPEAQGRLFEKFYQVADRRRGKVGGTGLGLAFCRQMIEAHGGAIWVESPSPSAAESGLLPPLPAGFQPDGASFRFTLPL